MYCLVIDNNPEHQELAAVVLNDIGVTVGKSECSPECWTRVLTENPDLLIIDLEVKNDLCWVLLEQIRAHPDTRSIPVLCLSTNPEMLDQARTTLLCSNEARFLQKPYDLHDLEQAVAELVSDARQDDMSSKAHV